MWIDRHTYKWIDMDRQTVRQKEKWMYRRRMDRDRQIYGQKKSREDRQLGGIEKQIDRWVERWINEWTDRKFDKQIYRQKVLKTNG
jgi:hypothetical protein